MQRSIVVMIATLLLLLSGSGELLPAQPVQPTLVSSREGPEKAIEQLFKQIEEGISSGDVGRFAPYLAKQTFVSVRGKESGYFSANQASLILRNHFASKRITNFRLTKSSTAGDMPFATGGGAYMTRGTLETFQVYVALARVDARWVIAQFNVY